MYTAVSLAKLLGFEVGQKQKFSKGDDFQTVWS